MSAKLINALKGWIAIVKAKDVWMDIDEKVYQQILHRIEVSKPKMSKKRIIDIQNLLLNVAEKETGVILAMARITGWLIEVGVEVEK